MRKYLLSTLLLASSLMADLEYASDLDTAKKMAKKEHKGIFVILSKENCDACWYMQNIVFDNDDIVFDLEEKYIPLHVDIHNDVIPKGLGYIGTPTMYFLDEDAKKLKNGRIDGAQNVSEFNEIMSKVGSN